MKSKNLLRNIYIVLMILLFALIVSTPLLVNQGKFVVDEVVKEIIEAAMLFVLVVIGSVIYFLYKRRLNQKEKQLDETLNYIGAVNLQLNQIKSIFDALASYPESKKDFKYLFETLADKALAGVNSDWVLFRIIDTAVGKTLTEFTKARGPAVLLKCEISNKNLLENKNPAGCSIIASMQENFSIKVFCVMPVENFSGNQKILLNAIVNNLCLLYLIFESAAARPWRR